ncbi:MAG: 4Fe-4S binding protein [Spirochaetes bacterium]|nr:4Fe-4S binding protein [Spirochaetota bacterium]
MKKILLFQILTFITVLFLFVSGRIVKLVFIDQNQILSTGVSAVILGIPIGLIFYHLIPLIFAEGNLRTRILLIQLNIIILLIDSLVFILIKKIFTSNHFQIFQVTGLVISILLFIFQIFRDLFFNEEQIKPDSSVPQLPVQYQQLKPVKTLLQIFFRLFPNPEPTGIYQIGNPNKMSPIIITGNYELTIRRVIKNISDIDCWLLVCNSRGVNIWCSSLANHFTTDDIIEMINRINLNSISEQKKIILPQLCAGNISIQKIKSETGFQCTFGPLSSKNLKNYLNNTLPEAGRLATFHTGERVEMALACPIIISIIFFFIYNFIHLPDLVIIIPVLYILSVIQAIIFPYRFIKNVFIWSLTFGLLAFILSFVFNRIVNLPLTMGLSISLGITYIINEFTGWSPLVKYSFLPVKKPSLSINPARCTGCGLCIQVCPKGVFHLKNHLSQAAKPDQCIQCHACFTQCPTHAIQHNLQKNKDSF